MFHSNVWRAWPRVFYYLWFLPFFLPQSCLFICLIIFDWVPEKWKKFKITQDLGLCRNLPKRVRVCSCQALGSGGSGVPSGHLKDRGCRAQVKACEGCRAPACPHLWGALHRVPTQVRDGSPGSLTWGSLGLQFLCPGPRMEWQCHSATLQNQGAPEGQVAPMPRAAFLGLHSPRIWLLRCLLSRRLHDTVKKTSFTFFRLCSEGDLVWII